MSASHPKADRIAKLSLTLPVQQREFTHCNEFDEIWWSTPDKLIVEARWPKVQLGATPLVVDLNSRAQACRLTRSAEGIGTERRFCRPTTQWVDRHVAQQSSNT